MIVLDWVTEHFSDFECNEEMNQFLDWFEDKLVEDVSAVIYLHSHVHQFFHVIAYSNLHEAKCAFDCFVDPEKSMFYTNMSLIARDTMNCL